MNDENQRVIIGIFGILISFCLGVIVTFLYVFEPQYPTSIQEAGQSAVLDFNKATESGGLRMEK